MGGVAVMRAIAVEGVQVEAAILESPFDSLLSTVRNRFHSMGLPGTPGSELIVFWGSVQQGFNGFEHNPVDYAASITCPTLMLYGDNDPRVTPTEARSIYDRLAGPKEFASFPGAGHEALAVYAPERWKAEVGRFLERVAVK
jgi:alpha-beta hydrolase superfamily lysophospholipase